jgi:enamine deaminase RidA (YjgF/YER057c/UK114 family)
MAKRRNIQPDTLVTPRRKGAVLYSDAVSVEGRRFVFIAGQLSRDAAGNVVGKGDMRAQMRKACENVKTALEAAGASLADVVKITSFTTDAEEFFKHIEVRTEFFGDVLPTSTTVEIRRLASPEYLVEIEAIAVTD